MSVNLAKEHLVQEGVATGVGDKALWIQLLEQFGPVVLQLLIDFLRNLGHRGQALQSHDPGQCVQQCCCLIKCCADQIEKHTHASAAFWTLIQGEM